MCSKVSISAASRSCFPPLPPKSMLSSPVEAVAASQQASMQHHSTLILGGGGPSKSGKRAKCSLCGRNSQEVGFPLADLLYSHRKNAYFRINKIALLPMVEHFSQLFLSLLLPPVYRSKLDSNFSKVPSNIRLCNVFTFSDTQKRENANT